MLEPLWETPESLEPLMKLGCGMNEVISAWASQDEASSKSGVLACVSPPSSQYAKGLNSERAEASIEGLGDVSSSATSRSSISVHPELSPFVELYRNEQYLLGRRNSRAYVALKDGAEPRTILRALWQAAWLQNQEQPKEVKEQGYVARLSEASAMEQKLQDSGLSAHVGLRSLKESLEALTLRFPEFEAETVKVGWNASIINIKTSDTRIIVEN
jgi:hypothetical protein